MRACSTPPGRPLPGLFAAGELVGGLFFHNYPGGSGLTAGAVYGRRAGYAAAAGCMRAMVFEAVGRPLRLVERPVPRAGSRAAAAARARRAGSAGPTCTCSTAR